MTASQTAKKTGLSSLAEVSEMTGQSVQTLNNWFNDKPDLFQVVIVGCAVFKHKGGIIDFLSGQTTTQK